MPPITRDGAVATTLAFLSLWVQMYHFHPVASLAEDRSHWWVRLGLTLPHHVGPAASPKRPARDVTAATPHEEAVCRIG